MGSMAVVDEGIAVVNEDIVMTEECMVAVEEFMEHIVMVVKTENCGRIVMKEGRSLSPLVAQCSPGHTDQKQ